jgi:O-antigen/teichoic acid export membrane protein
MIFTIVLSPIWSAITEAYVKGEFLWIKNAMSKLFKLASLLSILTIFILIFSKVIVKIWIGDRLVVPISLCMIEALRTLIYMFFGPFITFLNGVSKIRLGFYLTIFETLVYLPLAYYLSVILSLGVLGILLASILVEVPLRICQPIQYFKIINNSAHGIWNR